MKQGHFIGQLPREERDREVTNGKKVAELRYF